MDGAWNGGAVRRKPAARGERRVMSEGGSGAVRGAAHCARREKSRDKWGTGRRAAKARGAENGDAMRRKGAARGARRVMSEGVRGRCAGLAEAPRRPRREAPETAEARRGARPLLNRRGAKYGIRW